MTPTGDRRDLAAVFDLLSDETRLAIVRALATHDRENPGRSTLAFSALRERVDARDPGRFNYHLGKLRGVLVEKTDRGYRLTPRGTAVARIVDDGHPLAEPA